MPRSIAPRPLDADSEDDPVPPPVQAVPGRVVELSFLTHDVRRVVVALDPGRTFPFAAGQHARLEWPDGSGATVLRDYSIASAPSAGDAGRVEFHVRETPGGRFGSAIASGALAVGTRIALSGPYGAAHLRTAADRPSLMIAGGTGLGPILSIAEGAVDAGLRAPMRVYVGMRDERDVYGEARLEALAARHPDFRWQVVLSQPAGATSRRTGFVTDAVAADHASLAGFKVYLAGPPSMIDAAVPLVLALGAARRDIHTDAADPAAALGAPTVPTE